MTLVLGPIEVNPDLERLRGLFAAHWSEFDEGSWAWGRFVEHGGEQGDVEDHVHDPEVEGLSGAELDAAVGLPGGGPAIPAHDTPLG